MRIEGVCPGNLIRVDDTMESFKLAEMSGLLCFVLASPFKSKLRLEAENEALRHGDLLKLGIDISQTSVAKCMPRRRAPPSQGWRTFLRNHADGIAAIDLFVVPTISFRPLYGLLIMGHGRRRDALHIHLRQRRNERLLRAGVALEQFRREPSPSVLGNPQLELADTVMSERP